MRQYRCSKCDKVHSAESLKYKCDCGGLFRLEETIRDFDFGSPLKANNVSLWRYEDLLPFSRDEAKGITLGEGMTPLIRLENNLFGKADFYMPTLSFKDRGAVMLVLMAKKLGFESLAIDSSGNAATSVSAYSSRAGIKCFVFVPEGTSESKLSQIKAHGAIVKVVEGNRAAAGIEARKFVDENKVFYASHIFNPYFYEGTKTYFYEVYEQLGNRFPDVFILPVGNGTLVMGAEIAFSEFERMGLIKERPQIIAVQALACSPIYDAFINEKDVVENIEPQHTIAEGIAISNPPRGEEILDIIKKSNGKVVAVEEIEIIAARKELAKKGIYVEPTSAVNYAAFIKLRRVLADKITVIPFCGAGIKSS